jgi:membrane protein YqaA with SNARE-associated domain
VNLEWLQAGLGIYAATYVTCFLSGILPVINAELYLLAVSALVGEPSLVVAVTVLAAAGQMTAKVLLFYAGRGAVKLPWRRSARSEAQLERGRARVAAWQQRKTLILSVSSVVGLPPFFLVAMLAGAIGIRFAPFLVIGMIGRTIRFAAFVLFGQLI